MKYDEFRRSENVEDYTDPSKPVINIVEPSLSLNDMIQLNNSQLAKDAGSEDIKGK